MEFCEPRNNILQMGLREGMRIADIGAGSGHYALAAAPIVGHDGRVYAVDVQEEVLKRLKQQASERGYSNVEIIWADAEAPLGTRFKDKVLDAAIVSNVLFQIEDKQAFAKEVARILKPEGKLLVIDWAGEYGGIGPQGYCLVPEHTAEKLFLDTGFYKEKAFRAGPHHWALLFKKSPC